MSTNISARLDRLERAILKVNEIVEIDKLKAENIRLKAELESLKSKQINGNIPIKVVFTKTQEIDTSSLNAFLSNIVSVRVRNCIIRGYPKSRDKRVSEIDLTVGEVLQIPKEELFKYRNFGEKAFRELKNELKSHNFGKFVGDNHWLKGV